ncbi:septal ring lytic transglycosylase RlpA family protein [Acinetobacter terrae]|jgi:rare lipoprotein A|uniref:Endolytic peptidoglycan transglycosylase RlpA n=1 Tax=Acinetobacter terrae TaxID=2731247 RepID=A0A2C9WRT5_9GAMM|nr:septal ring lytic transglycosylase RlpA family protein [Acinetobacter terrae]NNG76396.1 septal ring lytic transglycosylase RlpA family protein [Acinetobacter terrae]NNH16417.1 septal ring lytic transglycosylase RlpA family protein [Acinetobacter terrae]NNH37075.1 septal ring lytic transglycosylase RlpA family protein [Acinetobacter terrae]NNH77421.1 septal ring lytic transglycosylase RlpA family protein [Acinetobacter terrae]NNH87792.1 septal ring lytic transglycosylase RlpA family protein 
MHSSIKYILALSTTFALSQSQAELVQSSFNTDHDNSRLATRVLNKDAQKFNSHFSNLNSLSITERSGDKIRRQTIAAKIEIPEDEPSVIEKLNTVASNTVRKFSQTGAASWYGRQFHGRKTASGETFDMNGLTAAHRSLPLNCYIRVTNKTNGKSVVVKVNDRGPFHGNRVLDLSYGAAKQLGITNAGTAKVNIERVDGPNS